MGLRSHAIASALLIGAATLAPGVLPAAADHVHPGRVVERGSDAPVSADVKAWASARQTNDPSSCPEFDGNPVDARVSDASTGSFALKVPVEVRTYTVAYCANGYHRKVDRHLPNSDDGTPVIPTPARLRKQSEAAMLQADSAAMSSDTVRLTIFALNELAYLYEVNPEGFERAIDEYGRIVAQQDDRAAEALVSLPNLLASWTAR